MSERTDRTAIVIGASIAGNLAAGVLAKHFDKVVVLEVDELPTTPGPRRGVPHAQHFHLLLERGRQGIEEIYPGYTELAIRSGARRECVTDVSAIYRRFGRAPRFPSDVSALFITRDLIEWTLREKARELSNVTCLSQHRVEGLVVEDGTVSGVIAETPDGESLTLDADLIVDASGRGSLTPKWLEAAGQSVPEEQWVDAHWGYSSTFAEFPNGFMPDFLAFIALPGAEQRNRSRGVTLWAQENGRWLLTAVGSGGDYPPSREPELREFIASLGYEELDKAMTELTFTSKTRMWRNTVNRLRRYDLLDGPEGFVVMGDAFAAFNPVYGQGIAVSAIEAGTLESELSKAFETASDRTLPPGFSRAVQKAFAPQVLASWSTSTGADYRVDGVEASGPPPEEHAARIAFMDRVEALAAEDASIYLKFMETTHLLRSPAWLAEPELRRRVVQDWDRLAEVVGAPAAPAPTA